MIQNNLLFLGTGASSGIPMLGCHCSVCRSKNKHNKRLRPSALLSLGNKKILIDAGPDFRFQALRYGIDSLDGVLLTHSHYDHIAGLDELRSYYLTQYTVLHTLASRYTYDELKLRFHYLFQKKEKGKSLAAQLEFFILEEDKGQIEFLDTLISYVTYEQGGMKVTGYKIGPFAYISDIHDYPETIFNDLDGVQTLVVSALREKPSPMHLTFEEAISFSKKIGAKKTYFTHIGHETDHVKIQKQLPQDFYLAYDGLQIEL